MNRVMRMWQAGLSLLLFSNVALADWSALNMRQGVTEISRDVYDLHMLIFYVCCVIGVLVFGVMIALDAHAPEIPRRNTGHLSRGYPDRNCLDGDSNRYPSGRGGPGHQHAQGHVRVR